MVLEVQRKQCSQEDAKDMLKPSQRQSPTLFQLATQSAGTNQFLLLEL